MATIQDSRVRSNGAQVAGIFLLGAAVAVALGVYAKVHTPAGRPIFLLGFSGMLQMKTWLTTGALVLIVFQLATALWMWGRLPGAGSAPPWAPVVHRWVGSTAFVLTLPVAFHCIWSIGLALMLAGGVAFTKLPLATKTRVELPKLTVNSTWSGASGRSETLR